LRVGGRGLEHDELAEAPVPPEDEQPEHAGDEADLDLERHGDLRRDAERPDGGAEAEQEDGGHEGHAERAEHGAGDDEVGEDVEWGGKPRPWREEEEDLALALVHRRASSRRSRLSSVRIKPTSATSTTALPMRRKPMTNRP